MRRALLALLLSPLPSCYTGLPPGRGGGPCVVDEECGGGTCLDGTCVPASSGTATGLPGESSASAGSSSSDDGSSGDTGSASGANTSGDDSGGGSTSSAGSASSTTTTTTSGGASTGGLTSDGGGSSTGAGSTGEAPPTECDPNDPMVEVLPGPGDKPGDECCTTRDSCTGKDVMGNPAQVGDVGDQMECVNGVWTVDETECTETCEMNGNSYLGCFWDSYYGLASPLCGCQ